MVTSFYQKKRRKNHKGLVILGIILLLIIVALACANVLISQKSMINDYDDTTDKSLNRYSNYLLYQTDTDEKISDDIIIWPNDTIEANLSSENDANGKEFFGNLASLFDQFTELYYEDKESNIENIDDDEGIDVLISGLIRNNTYSLQVIKYYADIPRVSFDDMEQYYLLHGGDETEEYVRNAFEEATLLDNATISDYGSTKIEIAKSLRSLYDQYTTWGCISNQILDKECIQINTTESVSEEQNYLTELENEANDTEWHIVNDVVKLSQSLNKAYYSKESTNEQ